MIEKNIFIKQETKKELLSEIKSFFLQELDHEIGDLKAEIIFDFIINKFGPKIYNQGVADARKWFRERFEDLDADFFLLEK